MYKIGWFSTGRGQGSLNLLQAMVNAVKDGTVKAEIAYVFCSRQSGDAPGSDRYINQVKDYGLNLICFSSKRFKPELRKKGKTDPDALTLWRQEYDREIMKLTKGISVNITVLAGYMLVVSPEMCEKHDMINLHPAAPDGPAGTWQEVIWQLIEQRADSSGNMMHLVTRELDKGSPITCCSFSLRGEGFDSQWSDLEEKLKKKPLREIIKEEGESNLLFGKIRKEGVKRELPLVIETVRAFAEGRLLMKDRKIFAEGKALHGPFCLNEEIEKQLQELSFP